MIKQHGRKVLQTHRILLILVKACLYLCYTSLHVHMMLWGAASSSVLTGAYREWKELLPPINNPSPHYMLHKSHGLNDLSS